MGVRAGGAIRGYARRLKAMRHRQGLARPRLPRVGYLLPEHQRFGHLGHRGMLHLRGDRAAANGY
jgi:hypothetical protein